MEGFNMFYIIQMKKIVFAFLIACLVLATTTSTSTCNCGSTSTSNCGSTSTCNCGSTSGSGSSGSCTTANCQPSFDVNSQVCVQTPTISVPNCLIPTIEAPCVAPPTTTPPCIETPDIDVPDQCVPSVVAPPTINIPTICVPDPVIPDACTPTGPVISNPTQPCLPVIDIPTAPGSGSGCGTQTLSNQFTLSLQYACRQNVDFGSCLADVVFNGRIVLSIVPTDYAIHTYSVVVTVTTGVNTLQIEGAGVSDSYGLFIDNVKLIRQGTSQNIVVNGGFEEPSVGQSWGIFSSIPGWTGVGIEIGYGTIYHNGWNSQVLELDGHSNYQVTQNFNFDSFYHLVDATSCSVNSFSGKTLDYTLEFDYAARKNGVSSAFTSRADVIWNNVVVGSINPSDYSVHHGSIAIKLQPGENVLSFDAASTSDSFGLTIDNVKITSVLNSTNLVVNGNFETPYVGGSGSWNYYNGGIYGWSAVKAEIGGCKSVYNSDWQSSTGQCAELDSDSNQRYSQKIIISQVLFANLLVQQAANQGNCQANSQLTCDIVGASNQISHVIATTTQGIYCQINMKVQDFNNYLCKLYNRTDAHVNGLLANQDLVLSQYDCLSDAYTSQFGSSNQVDFTDDYFNHTSLSSWAGYVQEIHGKVIKCNDGNGNHHWLQISPSTHFEGQFPAPQLGAKIFWTGAQDSSCGRTFVKWATTCNC